MKINNWEEADRALAKFAQVEATLASAAALHQTLAQELQANYDRLTRVDLEKHALLEKALKKFAVSRKNEFMPAPNGDGRSYEYAGAVLGFRQSPGRVEIRNEEKTIEWLRDIRNGKFIRVLHEPNREALLEALRDGSDERLVEVLAAHGITFQQKDRFFLEVKNEG